MTRTPWISDYFDEYELDSKGNPVETINGPKLTARAKAAKRTWLQMMYRPKRLQPLDQLPPELFLHHTHKKGWRDPPRYNFGWGLAFKQLYDYGIKHRLVSRKCHSVVIVEAAVKELDRLCGARLYLDSVSDAEHDWIVARYSNYTWYEEVLKERDEQAVIEIVQRELQIRDAPRWYRQLKPERHL